MQTSPYHWISRLGTGSSGEVWAAVRSGKEIAVKVLRSRPGSAHGEALRREMRLGPILAGHPNIVAVDRVEQVQGALHLEMEWVRGPSLADVLAWRAEKGQPPLPPSVVVPWAIQVLSALDWAGSRVAPTQPSSFVHRDIKPANLLLDTDGRLRITDFGIARAEAELGFQTTHAGTVKGSPRYMAPEILSEAKVDARADQFSLGAVMYQLMMGEPLYRGGDLAATLLEALEADVGPRLDAFNGPIRVRKILTTLLAKDRNHRYTNHRVAADALRALRLSGSGVQTYLPKLLEAVPVEIQDAGGPSLSRLPDLGGFAEYPTGTDDIRLAADTLDLPSLDLDVSIPPVSALLADRDKGDTVPLRRGFLDDPATERSVTHKGYSSDLARDLAALEDGSVTAPIPMHDDEEDTVLKSMDELAHELSLLGIGGDEHTVASIELPEESSLSETDGHNERTVVLPEVEVRAPPPPRTPVRPPPQVDDGAIPVWVYGAVGCSFVLLALAVVIAGVAVGLLLARM
ncbi:MAG: serine/threonine protein kinase [Proteobacteria bacterium]|nr:serine/threonine protein kinase [Pseudomonadota bacterium]